MNKSEIDVINEYYQAESDKLLIETSSKIKNILEDDDVTFQASIKRSVLDYDSDGECGVDDSVFDPNLTVDFNFYDLAEIANSASQSAKETDKDGFTAGQNLDKSDHSNSDNPDNPDNSESDNNKNDDKQPKAVAKK